ncbi:endonuclease III [Buchnera aphidicola (Cinara tujafilina)]|uniref:Endonuclease III n=1 Tax=Buchnera aphidicola (Cinara tujafilina) TaxID=261317 RepID=F7WZ17_9GAMM|nr:endonuclease III [Buchnera aphidicola]AEH39667.1 endonuclease III [Buchnera aphidicola (Cinara tujafilina)]
MNNVIRRLILQEFEIYCEKPATELRYSSDFELLISVILSAQVTDKQVNIVTKKLFKIASTPMQILNLGYFKLKLLIKSLGLYNKKTLYIINLCKILQNKYKGKIPRTQKTLLSLPGVGKKTANIILNTIFYKNYIAVDRHVFRVCNRTGFVTGCSTDVIEKKLMHHVPIKYILRIHNWFVLHGRYICKARKPKCHVCIINKWCKYFKNIKC